MSISSMFRHSWGIVWNHKFLAVLGLVFLLGGNALSGIQQLVILSPGYQAENDEPGPYMPGLTQADARRMFAGMFQLYLVCFVVICLPFWAVARMCFGGIIATTRDAISQQPVSFDTAVRAGWGRLRPLLGIGALGAVPVVLLSLGHRLYFQSVIIDLMRRTPSTPTGPLADAHMVESSGVWGTFIGIAAIGGLVILPLIIWSLLAEHACMLERTGVFDSYRRGWAVLTQHIREAASLAVVQIGLAVPVVALITAFMLILGVVSVGVPFVLFCFLLLVPLLIVCEGFVLVSYLAMWTLAWLKWTESAAPPEAAVPAA